MLSEKDLIYIGSMLLYSSGRADMNTAIKASRKMFDSIFGEATDNEKEQMILE